MPAPRDRSYEQAITDVLQQISQAVDLAGEEAAWARHSGQQMSYVRRLGRMEALQQLAQTLEILRDGE